MTGGFDAKAMIDTLDAVSQAGSGRENTVFCEEDGLYHCSLCGGARQCRINFFGQQRTVWCACECMTRERDAVERQMKRQAREKYRRAGFGGSSRLLGCTFEADDSPDSKLSMAARSYAEKFSPDSDWLLLCGPNGVGKSFYAAAICSAVFERGFDFRFLTVPELSRELWSAEDKGEVFRKLDRRALLVIDDLGEERGSEYMTEITFDLIDGRLRSGKPCIITTNKTADDIINCSAPGLDRISSRIAERSVPLVCGGEDRRKKAMRDQARTRLERLGIG